MAQSLAAPGGASAPPRPCRSSCMGSRSPPSRARRHAGERLRGPEPTSADPLGSARRAVQPGGEAPAAEAEGAGASRTGGARRDPDAASDGRAAPEQRHAPPAPPEELTRADGMPGGLGNAGGTTAGVAVLATDADGHVEYDDALMSPPERISGPDPEYTYLARAHDVQGVMLVKCLVTILGVVRDCRVVQGLPYMDGAVVDALLRRRYTPARLADGRAVEVEFTFRVRLQLVR